MNPEQNEGQGELFKEPETKYKHISLKDKDIPTAVASLREKACIALFKRFSRQKLKGSVRQKRRKVSRWLDKEEVKFIESKGQGVNFTLKSKNKTSRLHCHGFIDKQEMRVYYYFEFNTSSL